MSSEGHLSVNYEKKAIPFSLNQRIVRPQQQRIFEIFAEEFPPNREWRVLDLGVNGSLRHPDEHFFEANYPFLERVTACGLESPEIFVSCYPQIKYVQGRRDGILPFKDGEFDLVFCNAVIEHVGSRAMQAGFIREILRVSKNAFITTPNRWFPVELHTILPLIHYLPTPVYRKIFQILGFDFFSREENLNLLDRSALKRLIDKNVPQKIISHYFLGFPSNLLLVIKRP